MSSILAKRIARLEELRYETKELEKEIGEMLGLSVPKRSYTKRSPELPEAETDDENDKSGVGSKSLRVGRKLQGQKVSPDEATEILRLAQEEKKSGPEIVRATGRSLAAVARVIHDAGFTLTQLRGLGKLPSPPRQAAGLAVTSPLEKKILALREQGKGQVQIAREVRKVVAFVRDVLKKHGMNSRITDQQRALVLQLHAEGKTLLKDIAAKAKLSKSATREIIKKGAGDKDK